MAEGKYRHTRQITADRQHKFLALEIKPNDNMVRISIQIQIQIQKDFIATQNSIFYIQTQWWYGTISKLHISRDRHCSLIVQVSIS